MVPPVEVYSILGLDCSFKIDSYVGIFEILLDIFNITLVNHFVFAGHAVVSSSRSCLTLNLIISCLINCVVDLSSIPPL